MSEARITGTTDPDDNGGAPTIEATPPPPKVVAPVVETPVEEPKAGEDGVVELKTPVDAKDDVPHWAQRRINKATAEREAALRRVQELEILIAGAAPPKTEGEPARVPATHTAEEFQAQVRQEAARIAFNQECQRVTDEGVREFPDFERSIGDLYEKASMTPFAVETILEFDAPHRVLKALSQNLDESSRIFSIPSQRKQITELTKFALSLEVPKTKARVTKAPDPIETKIGGPTKGEVSLESENVSAKEWIAERQRQIDARRKAGDRRAR